MTHHSADIGDLQRAVAARTIHRRDVLKRGIALGLTAPAIAQLLAACGGDDDDDVEPTTADTGQTAATATSGEEATVSTGESRQPSATEVGDRAGEAGGHGLLRLLWWQAPTILNPHLSQGGKDLDASRLITEPLAEFDNDGNLVPFLAAEVPTRANGGLAEDGTSVTWKLRENATWHDGEPFTSKDVKFTYEWATHPQNVVTSAGAFTDITSVETPDDFTVVITFERANPAWFKPFVGNNGRILPEHILKDHMGSAAADAPFNLSPVGTGPFMVREFQPGDLLLADRYPDYWDPGKPHFDEVELKGGGDAASAARAVLQTGEVDYAWNLQVEKEVLDQVEGSGDGVLIAILGTQLERIVIQMMDPNEEEDGELAKLGHPHPFLSDLEVRQALTFACDREAIATNLYGAAGAATANWIVAPERLASPNTSFEFNVETAGQMLDDLGWTVSDGKRQKDDVAMSMRFQTTVNSVRQKTQEIIKQAFEELGIEVEIKAIDGAVFFSSAAGNPDTWQHFYADLQMWTAGSESPYPTEYLRYALSLNSETDIPQKSNNWTGRNMGRWINDEYNAAYEQALTELDEEKQVELFVKMNDLVVNEVASIPLIHRGLPSAQVADLENVNLSKWTTDLWDVASWSRRQS